ncbi:MAG: hypothetical protein RLZ98_144 [Pseudomonadota bacterium]|jgi:uncharacterized protein (DUF924 family)
MDSEIDGASWAEDVLANWFDGVGPEGWFRKDDRVDAEIRRRFLPLHARLSALEDVSAVTGDADTSLAAIIVLDQFSRNMFRNSPAAFATDDLARRIADHAIGLGYDSQVAADRRVFFYLPFEHSEDAGDQRRSVRLISALGDDQFTAYAEAHKAVIDRFGRFPHRNGILGRISTPEEEAYLSEPGSGF